MMGLPLKWPATVRLLLFGHILGLLCYRCVVNVHIMVQSDQEIERIIGRAANSSLVGALRNSTTDASDTDGEFSTGRTTSYSDAEQGSVSTQKPQLVLHLGPEKTGTTSLQHALMDLQDSLAEEGYRYGGKFCVVSIDKGSGIPTCGGGYDISPLIQEANTMFHPTRCMAEDKIECVNEFKTQLLEFRDSFGDNLPSIILSHETLQGQWFHNFGTLTRALQSDWDIIYVVSYRRFYEWLPSKLHQRNKYEGSATKIWKQVWPRNGGLPLDQLFPDIVREWETRWPVSHFTDSIIKAIESNAPLARLAVLDTHRPESIQTNFVCNILTHAPKTCELCKLQDEERGEESMNVRKDVDWEYVDQIIMAAEARNMIDSQASGNYRIRIDKRFQSHVETTLGTTIGASFEKKCPSAAELDTFLQRSLQYEVEIFGVDAARELEAEVREDFAAKVEAGSFCEIDIDVALQNPILLNYVESLPRNR